MVDPSTHYDLGRLNVLVEYNSDREMWLVSALRQATPRLKSASVVAWCSSAEMAQELAHLIIGIEITRGSMTERAGAAIWPDGRTEPSDPYVSPDDVELDPATARKYQEDRRADDQPEEPEWHKHVLRVIAHLHRIRQVESAVLLRTLYNELRDCRPDPEETKQ